jgi:hypothetical protein
MPRFGTYYPLACSARCFKQLQHQREAAQEMGRSLHQGGIALWPHASTSPHTSSVLADARSGSPSSLASRSCSVLLPPFPSSIMWCQPLPKSEDRDGQKLFLPLSNRPAHLRSCRIPVCYSLRSCPREHAGWNVPPFDQQ